MADIRPVAQPGNVANVLESGRAQRPAGESAVRSRASDKVELSNTAQLLNKLRELPDVRQDMIDRIRAELAAGTYDTPEKMDAALEKLLDDLS